MMLREISRSHVQSCPGISKLRRPVRRATDIEKEPSMPRLHSGGRIRSLAALLLALALPAIAGDTKEAVKLDSDALEGLAARALGPAAMSGRIAAIDGVAGDRTTLWVGSASGGVWKSTDGGVTFKAVFDKYTQSIGAIEIGRASCRERV